MNPLTTVEISPAQQYMFDRNLIENTYSNLFYNRFGQVRTMEPGHSGVKFSQPNKLAAAMTPLTKGVVPPGSAWGYSRITVSPAQYGDYTKFDDEVTALNLEKLVLDCTKEQGEQVALTLDTIDRNTLHAGATHIRYANGVATRLLTVSKILYADIRMAINTLRRADAKKFTEPVMPSAKVDTVALKACYVAITHPDIIETLEHMVDANGDKVWIPAEKYQGNAGLIHPAERGCIGDIRFVESTNAPIWAGLGGASTSVRNTAGAVDVYGTIILGKDAYGVVDLDLLTSKSIIKGLGSAGSADPIDQIQTCGWKIFHAAVILKDSFIYCIESAAETL